MTDELSRLLADLQAHMDASPLGWSDGQVLIHRATMEPDIVEWLGRLRAITRGIALETQHEPDEPDEALP